MLPKTLKNEMTVGVYSPSSPATAFASTRSERAVAYLQKHGYKVKKGSLWGATDNYRSGSIQDRAAELNALIRDPDVDVIMSAIGGANSNSLLPYLDYDAIAASAKIFVGYSDVTAILLAIYAKTGLVTYYGPALTASLGEFPPLVDTTFNSFVEVASAPGSAHRYQTPRSWSDEMIDWASQDRAKQLVTNDVKFHGKGIKQGRVIGGNLNTITAIWGSEYMPEIQDGDILLLEDAMKDIAAVERLFAFLLLQGVFDKVAAVLLGKHELFNDNDTGRSPYQVLREVLNGRELAVVEGFDCCHTHPMLTVPIGAKMSVDFDGQDVSLLPSDLHSEQR